MTNLNVVISSATQMPIKRSVTYVESGKQELQPLVNEAKEWALRAEAAYATLAPVATSGSYNDLTDKPVIETVNNAVLTIQKNGEAVGTFTANAATNATANITVPTNTNELTNGAGFITSAAIPVIATSVSSASTNAETVGAKLFYDTLGDVETLLSEV